MEKGPNEFAKKHPSECESPWRSLAMLVELAKQAQPEMDGLRWFIYGDDIA